MAERVGQDEAGPWATVSCDREGCTCHVSVRPGPTMDEVTAYDMVCAAMDFALEDGWALRGRAYCPEHAIRRPGKRPTLADEYPWVNVRQAEGPRPS